MNAEPVPMWTFTKLSLPSPAQSSFPSVQLHPPALLQCSPNTPEEPFLVELPSIPVPSREDDGGIGGYDVDIRDRLMQLELQQLINALLSVSNPRRSPGRASRRTRADRSTRARTRRCGKEARVRTVRVLRRGRTTDALVSCVTTNECCSNDAGTGRIPLALVRARGTPAIAARTTISATGTDRGWIPVHSISHIRNAGVDPDLISELYS